MKKILEFNTFKFIFIDISELDIIKNQSDFTLLIFLSNKKEDFTYDIIERDFKKIFIKGLKSIGIIGKFSKKIEDIFDNLIVNLNIDNGNNKYQDITTMSEENKNKYRDFISMYIYNSLYLKVKNNYILTYNDIDFKLLYKIFKQDIEISYSI